MTDEKKEDINLETLEGGEDLMIEVDGELVPNYDATMVTFEERDIVTGTVVRIDNDEVLVDIGYKSEGVIPVEELSIRKSVDPADEVSLGDVVDAQVMTKEDADGRLILSKKRARFERAWRRIEEAAEEGNTIEGRVIEVVKGGLILDLGVRGFLPASLVDIRRVADLEDFVGQTLRCRVIELNRFRNNVVLSRRAVLEEERRGLREKILDSMNVGDLVTGTISNIVDFGAFVDLEGIDGLIHISELSWSHVKHPSEVLDIAQEVTVKVLDIDRERQRISLGLKQTQKDPWQEVFENRQVNEIVHGSVTKLVSFGAFVEIEEGVEGLIHISELAQHHVEEPSEILETGQEVNVKIIEIDPDRRRLSLSLKRLEPEYRIHEDVEEGEEEELEGEEELETEGDLPAEEGLQAEEKEEDLPAAEEGLQAEETEEDLPAAEEGLQAEETEEVEPVDAEGSEDLAEATKEEGGQEEESAQEVVEEEGGQEEESAQEVVEEEGGQEEESAQEVVEEDSLDADSLKLSEEVFDED